MIDNSVKEYTIEDPNILIKKLNEDLNKNAGNLSLFLKCLALCNALVSQDNQYLGSSADENALAHAADKLGYLLKNKESEYCELELDSHIERYEIIDERPFNDETKKSRLVLKSCSEGDYILFIKGSWDSMKNIFLDRLEIFDEIEEKVYTFSRTGLRTMIQGYKYLTETEVKEFSSKIKIANSVTVNFDEKIQHAYKNLEKDVQLLGITGISDEILPQTLETIEALKKAGIKI